MNFNVNVHGKIDWSNLTKEQRDTLNDVATEFVDHYEEGIMDSGVAKLSTDFEGAKPGDVLIEVPLCSSWLVNVAQSDMDAVCMVMQKLETVGDLQMDALHDLGGVAVEVAPRWMPVSQD